MGSNEQPLESTRQRLDKWLFFARMAKSRSLAQGYVQSGQVKVNGVTIRQPSHTVKAGDRLDIAFERMDRVLVVKSGGWKNSGRPARFPTIDVSRPPSMPTSFRHSISIL